VPEPIDPRAFERLIAPYSGELHAHCYRMLGSLQDADDALQETLIGAFRGYAGFEGRASLRGWLYAIATNACLQLIARRPRRWLAAEYRAATPPSAPLEEPLLEPVFLEPYPSDPHASYEARERVELAFIAALQHLPATQRAALVLCEVVGLSADEAASALETTEASINSALQRARETLKNRLPEESQQSTLRALGDEAQRALVQRLTEAWNRSDVDAIVALLAHDARFTMPPIPNWFYGPEDIAAFLRERVFATAWRAVPTIANAQLALALYQGPDFKLGALQVLTLRYDRVLEMTGFLDPNVKAFFLRRTDDFRAREHS
jgi:RNA polymerase sigma-70 factor (ECF subfamily)